MGVLTPSPNPPPQYAIASLQMCYYAFKASWLARFRLLRSMLLFRDVSIRLSVCPSVCLSYSCIVLKRLIWSEDIDMYSASPENFEVQVYNSFEISCETAANEYEILWTDLPGIYWSRQIDVFWQSTCSLVRLCAPIYVEASLTEFASCRKRRMITIMQTVYVNNVQ